MAPLDRSWEGLRFSSANRSGWTRDENLFLPESALLLHQQGGRRFRVHRSGSVWKFIARVGYFDYYPAGTYDAVLSGPEPMQAIHVAVPGAFENSVLVEGHWPIEMSPRFQFQDRRLEALMLAMQRAVENGSPAPDAVMLSVAVVDRLYEIALPMERDVKQAEFTDIVKRLIVEYLDHYIGSSIAVGKVAELTGLARTQFAKLFRESFRVPLHQYVISRKIQIATRRLLDDVLVTDISHELGFASHAHFSTVFKTHVGTTPSEYRRSILRDGTECMDA